MYINNDNNKRLTHAPNPNSKYRAKSLIMNACVRACLLAHTLTKNAQIKTQNRE